MGRKSLAEIRSDEILRAFERSIIRHGLDVSLEQIATEMGIRRSLIRHYLGNRDDLVDALIEHITQSYLQDVRTKFAHLAIRRDEAALVDYLLDFDENYGDRDRLIIDVLVTAKERYPHAKQNLQHMFTEVIRLLTDTLARIYPAATTENCRHIAYTLFCLISTHETMRWIDFGRAHDATVRNSAMLILETLKRPPSAAPQAHIDT